MKEPKRVTIPVLHVPVVYMVDCPMAEAAKAFYDYKGERSIFEPTELADGGVAERNGYVFMWIENTKGNASVVIHELVHVAFSALGLCNISHDEEHIAYLMGWLKINIMDEIYFGSNNDNSEEHC